MSKFFNINMKEVVIGVEFQQNTIYLSPHKSTNYNDNLQHKCSHMFLISAFDEKSFAKDVIQNTELRTKLKEKLEGVDDISVYSAFAYRRCAADDQDVGSNYMEATALCLPKTSSSQDDLVVSKVEECLKSFEMESSSYYRITLDDLSGHITLEGFVAPQMKRSSHEIFVHEKPRCHPAFFERNTNSVCHDFQTSFDLLSQFTELDEVNELLSIGSKYLNYQQEELPHRAKYPVVVLEGLDACGKTTLCANINTNMNAAVLKSPPSCIDHLRIKFDKHPPPLRRAFYSFGNYIFSKMISNEAQHRIVICDRYWHSTAAYAIATDVKNGDVSNLPPSNHWVWSWPDDLLKPDVAVFLYISDETRRMRLLKRGEEKTDEEIRLEKSRLFRERLEECYNRMENPSVTQHDASGSPQQVFQSFKSLLAAMELMK